VAPPLPLPSTLAADASPQFRAAFEALVAAMQAHQVPGAAIGLLAGDREEHAADGRCLPHRSRLGRDPCASGFALAPSALIERGAKVVKLDRDEPHALAHALGAGADVLVDSAGYNKRHARELLGVQSVLGSPIVISSSSVYRDRRGRTLDEAARPGSRFPRSGQRGRNDHPRPARRPT
jgi:hypothetical protein